MSRLQFIALLTPAVGSFVLVVLAWLYSNNRLSRLDATLDTGIKELRDHLSRVDFDLKQFYHLTGKLEGRIDTIEKR